MTLSRSEVLAARNGTEPTTRTCVKCGKPLSARQQRACSKACARSLGATSAKRAKSQRRGTTKPGPLAFLDTLPPYVSSVSIEHGGWKVEATRA